MTAEAVEYLKVAVILAVTIAAAIIVLRFGLPRLTNLRAHDNGPVRVLYRLGLEPRKTLYVVHAGSEYVMLAASDSGVQLLTTLNPEAMAAAFQKSSPDAKPGIKP
jgi:flagellar biogenesis protein FliO